MNGLREYEDDLEYYEQHLVDELRPVHEKAGVNIKTGAQKTWRAQFRHGHAKHLPRAVSYDVTANQGADFVTLEVGPVLTRKQGALGGIVEEGTLNNAPVPALYPAATREEPKLADHVGRVAERLLDGRTR